MATDDGGPRYRYQNDSDYRALVDHMVAFIMHGRFTPSELREAAVLAGFIFLERATQTLGQKRKGP